MYRFFFGAPTEDFRLIQYRKHIRNIMGFGGIYQVKFEDFVKRLHNFNRKRPQYEKDRHLVPQTASCFIPQGMRYNYILKVFSHIEQQVLANLVVFRNFSGAMAVQIG
eukprot:TRINITY_DN738_c0_g2_i2.p2 TRINITY_DN738_c0_g2~~TRINITY_DN738_c0_g2_i2.p2  ORF type:complete len:108 (-),score=3.42 TRINITY_DN738_c0_g2_i2:48-371(-)